MKTPKKLFTEPKISPESHDLSVKWYVWFRFFDVRTGKWTQRRYYGDINKFKTIKERLPEANSIRRVLKEDLESGWNPMIPQQPVVRTIGNVNESIEFLLKEKAAGLKRKTGYAYKYICDNFTDWCEKTGLAAGPLKSISVEMAQSYMDHLQITKGYSGRTYNDHLLVLRTFFNAFQRRKLIAENPFHSVKWKPESVGRNHAFTPDEEDALRNYLVEHDPQLYFVTQFMYYCFLRRPEVVAIRVRHIDLWGKTLIVPGDAAKNNTQEGVVIPVGLEPIIGQMKFGGHHPDDFVFGRHLKIGPTQYKNPNHITSRHAEVIKKLGISQEKGLYSWKHTGACRAYYATGKDIYSLMRQLRHRDLNTTMIYLKSLGLVQNDIFRQSMTG